MLDQAEEDAKLAKEGSDKLSLAEGNGSNGAEDAAVAAVRDLVASPSYTPKKVQIACYILCYILRYIPLAALLLHMSRRDRRA